MRSLTAARHNIRRTPYQSWATATILTLLFFVGSIFVLVALGSQFVLRHFETKPQVIAYLADQATADQAKSLADNLKAMSSITSVKYVSKDEALAIYKESVNNDPLLLGTITELGVVSADMLPASLEISVTDPSKFKEVVDVLQKSDLVANLPSGKKDIDFPEDVITELTAWTKGLRMMGLTVILVQAVLSVLTIVIFIGMKVRSRSFEINTMKLLGAPGGFIVKPYLIEAIIYASIGAFFGWLFAYIGLLYATPFLAPRLSGIIDLPISPIIMVLILFGEWLAALLLALVAGLLATLRFVRR